MTIMTEHSILRSEAFSIFYKAKEEIEEKEVYSIRGRLLDGAEVVFASFERENGCDFAFDDFRAAVKEGKKTFEFLISNCEAQP